MNSLWTSLEHTPFATFVRTNGFAFPWVESVHVLAICLVVGTISIVDLRLLGYTSRDKGVRHLVEQALPFTWAAFALALITGFLLFSSSANTYAADIHFRIKMLLLLAAGVNMLVFHFIPYRSVHLWDDLTHPPMRARICGGLSLACWIGVVTMGRWVGFSIQ
jgi:hypothetical protein